MPQLNQNRVGSDGTRGSGSLYAMGLNYSLTGVFYNKKLAAQIGMTEPPKTLAEFEDLLAKAKAAGLQPIMEWGSAKSGMGLAFPLQNLMAAYGPAQPINDWIFQKNGATIDTPTNLDRCPAPRAVDQERLLPADINAIEYTDATARFGKGEGVFTFNGDWQNAGYDKDMPGNVGFFLMPPAEAGGSLAAMSAPLTYGIAAKAKNADCAAFFLNWVATNDTARADRRRPLAARTPAVRRMPRCRPSLQGSVTNETLAAGPVVGKADGAMDFIANATELDLRPGLDARAPEDGRRQARRCRAPQGRPGRIREGTGSAVAVARGRCLRLPDRSERDSTTIRQSPRGSRDLPADLPH